MTTSNEKQNATVTLGDLTFNFITFHSEIKTAVSRVA
jgi:hypothetical protein